ncbi:MAG: transcription antitermination factor NusB [Myxococcota bacterium]
MADARDVALEVLRRVDADAAFASTVLRAELQRRKASPADAGLATEIVYGLLRKRSFVDAALAHVSGRRIKDIDRRLIDILRIGAYQLMELDRIPDHAAVDLAVRQAKRRKAHGGFVNAVLRKLARTPAEERLPKGPDPDAPAERQVSFHGGVPLALAKQLVDDLGPEEALAFARASLASAPLTLRVHPRAEPTAIAAEVGGAIGELPYAVHLPGGGLPADLDCVRRGDASPQDEAAMRVVELLAPEPGETILDLCAAPGGKTTHIAERLAGRGRVLAYDRLPRRLARVAENAARLRLDEVETIDVLPAETERFDRVLVDAPCSGLGTLRRHPELRWKFDPNGLAELTRTQDLVLGQGLARLGPGGVLVYSVCTITKAEGENRLAHLGPDFEVEHSLRTGPHESGAPDGFFMARIRRAH